MTALTATAPAKPVYRVRAGDATGASARPAAMAADGGRAMHGAADVTAQAMAGWLPPLQSPDAGWLPDRDLSVARIRDLERNEGWASSGLDRMVDMLVGGVFRLNARPDAAGLGIDEDAAHELGRRIQTAWRGFAEDPLFRSDAQRRLPFAGQIGLLAREFVTVGEGLAVLRWKPRPGWRYATALQVVDPDRLSNPNGQPETPALHGGIEHDADGEPVAYWLRRGHPGDFWGAGHEPWRWDRIPRWDRIGEWERPKVIHVFDPRRPDQSRGVSRLVAALTKLRMLSRYAESEVRTAAINATIVGALYTELGSDYAAEVLGSDPGGGRGVDWDAFHEARARFYGSRRVLDDARLLTLFPTDRLDLNTQPRQTAGLPAFTTAFLQALAATLGVSYEQLAMDWSRTNYSSARAALNEVWRGVMRLRWLLIWMAATPVYVAWLEEALDSGEIDPPPGARDFYEAPAAWCRAEWIGPARGYIDPVKEAQSAVLRRTGMISTLEREAAEQGLDWEQVLDQLRREATEMARLGLPQPSTDLSIEPASDREPASGDRRERP